MPKTTRLPGPWNNHPPWHWSLAPKGLGAPGLDHPELLSPTDRLPVEGPQVQQVRTKLWRAAAILPLAAFYGFLQEGEGKGGDGLHLIWTPGLQDWQAPSSGDGLQRKSCELLVGCGLTGWLEYLVDLKTRTSKTLVRGPRLSGRGHQDSLAQEIFMVDHL